MRFITDDAHRPWSVSGPTEPGVIEYSIVRAGAGLKGVVQDGHASCNDLQAVLSGLVLWDCARLVAEGDFEDNTFKSRLRLGLHWASGAALGCRTVLL